MLQKFNGIVLKAKDYGESNQIISVFSDMYGKISIMARGSKKPRSRFSAITEPFTEAQFICYVGSGMATLSQGDINNAHRRIAAELLRTAYGAYWFELIDRLLTDKDPQPALFHMLSQLLTRLEEGTNPEILTRLFELRMMAVAGYQPVFEHCVNCRKVKMPFRLSVIQGGFLCSDCHSLDRQALSITPAVAKILPILQTIELNRLGTIEVKPQTEQMLKEVVHRFMQEYIPVEFKTKTILERLKD